MDTTGTPRFENPKPSQRYRIMSDESGHEYFIPVDEEAQFNAWVEATETGDSDYTGREYDGNRIDGHFSFTDPRCE